MSTRNHWPCIRMEVLDLSCPVKLPEGFLKDTDAWVIS